LPDLGSTEPVTENFMSLARHLRFRDNETGITEGSVDNRSCIENIGFGRFFGHYVAFEYFGF
ncbi:MAG: hypothetical protein R6U40_05255, partial [Desulfobacterales bacterium]